MKKELLQLVIFDLDGTLVDSIGEITDAVNDTLKHYGKPPTITTIVAQNIGHGMRQLFIDIWSAVCQISADEVTSNPNFEAHLATFNHHYLARSGTNSKTFPNVIETLEFLQSKQVMICLNTNKPAAHTQKVLEAFDIKRFFSHVYAADTLNTCKPNPEAALLCIKAAHATPQTTVFVGDSKTDVQTARNAGVPIWALPYGYTCGEPVSAHNPDRMIPDISALREFF